MFADMTMDNTIFFVNIGTILHHGRCRSSQEIDMNIYLLLFLKRVTIPVGQSMKRIRAKVLRCLSASYPLCGHSPTLWNNIKKKKRKKKSDVKNYTFEVLSCMYVYMPRKIIHVSIKFGSNRFCNNVTEISNLNLYWCRVKINIRHSVNASSMPKQRSIKSKQMLTETFSSPT